MSDFTKLEQKLNYNKKFVEEIDYKELQNFEEMIYGHVDEVNKIKYELGLLTEKCADLPESEKGLYNKIVQIILHKLDCGDCKLSQGQLDEIKQLIVAAQVFYDMVPGFYTVMKYVGADKIKDGLNTFEEKGRNK